MKKYRFKQVQWTFPFICFILMSYYRIQDVPKMFPRVREAISATKNGTLGALTNIKHAED